LLIKLLKIIKFYYFTRTVALIQGEQSATISMMLPTV